MRGVVTGCDSSRIFSRASSFSSSQAAQRMAPPSGRGASGSLASAEKWVDLPDFTKDLYLEHPFVSSGSEADAQAFRVSAGLVVRDAPSQANRAACPKPTTSFETCAFPKYITSQLRALGFVSPTPVQAQAWPLLLSGRNLLAVAPTGSGKTLSYLLPAIVHCNAQRYLAKGDGPIVTILAPTRELAMQINDQCTQFGASSRVKSVCVYGGADRDEQAKSLKNETLPEIVVATPGRLNDLLAAKVTNLASRCTFLVVDEADRMLDLGFLPQIALVSNQIRPDRQTVLVTATWPEAVRVAAAKLAPDAATLQVASLENIRNNTSTSGDITGVDVIPGDTARIVRGVSHSFTVLESNDHKYERLVKILEDRLMENNKNTSRVVAFCASKLTVDDTTRKLRKHGIPALAMHGDKTQTEREWVLERFRDGTSPVRISHSPHSADATDCPHPSAVSVWVFSQAFGPVRD